MQLLNPLIFCGLFPIQHSEFIYSYLIYLLFLGKKSKSGVGNIIRSLKGHDIGELTKSLSLYCMSLNEHLVDWRPLFPDSEQLSGNFKLLVWLIVAQSKLFIISLFIYYSESVNI